MCGKKLFAKNTRQLTNSFRQYLVKYSPTAIFGKHLLTKQTTHSGQKVSAIVRPFVEGGNCEKKVPPILQRRTQVQRAQGLWKGIPLSIKLSFLPTKLCSFE